MPAEVEKGVPGGVEGIHLALEEHFNSIEGMEWEPNQDLVFTLRLMREGDTWVRPEEGYLEVLRLRRSGDGQPCLLEIRSAHLRDYLCARDMSLYVATCRERDETVEDASHIAWPSNPMVEEDGKERWEGRIQAIAEGGDFFGSGWAVFRMAWSEEFGEGDVPVLGDLDDDSIKTETWEGKAEGRQLQRIEGALWRTERIDSAARSPMVRGDEEDVTASFVIDAEGCRAGKGTLPSGRAMVRSDTGSGVGPQERGSSALVHEKHRQCRVLTRPRRALRHERSRTHHRIRSRCR